MVSSNLFAGFISHADNNPITPPEAEKARETTFTTQAKLLKEVTSYKKYGIVGLCSPLSNEYAMARMKGEEASFLTDPSPNRVFSKAYKLLMKEAKLDRRNQDGSHIAFHDKVYSVHNVSKRSEPLTASLDEIGPETQENLHAKDADYDKLLKKHNLVTYPYREDSREIHQVYFGRDNATDCTVFNADVEGGEKKGPCSQLIAELAETSKQFLREDGRNKVIIASTNGEDKPGNEKSKSVFGLFQGIFG